MFDDAFEWDEAKAEGNLRKHGVGFEAARIVFQDAFAIERNDTRRDYGEERFVITGMVKGRPLTVVYTERGDYIRIISARRSSGQEQHDYHQNQTEA
jgi:uncharacterized protein